MPGARSPVRDEGAGRLTVNPALLVGRLVRTSPVEWTIRHPTDPATVARYGYDGRRGIYIDIEHEGAVVFRYDGREVDQGVRDVLEELVVFAFLGGADARLSTWYSLVSSTALFVALSLGTLNWQPPQTPTGWMAIVGMSVAITSGFLFIFVSTLRVGAFRTALIMNLEPLLATVLSALLLGEVITPVQGLGAGIMLAALVAFQLWR